MGLWAMIFVFWMLSFKPDFSLCSFTFTNTIFSSSSLSAIRVVFNISEVIDISPGNLDPACDSSSPAFCMMYSAYKLNKQGDCIQPWHTPFPIWNQSVLCSIFGSNYCFLTCIQISQEADQVVWYSHLLKNFLVCCDPHNQSLWRSQQGRSRCFSGNLLLFLPMDVGNLISGYSALSKSRLNIWKFSVHVLLKPHLENFDRYFASVLDECNCVVVWTFLALPIKCCFRKGSENYQGRKLFHRVPLSGTFPVYLSSLWLTPLVSVFSNKYLVL